MTIELKEKYGLSDYQIKKLSQIRLDMLTTEKYEECKCEMARIEDARKQRADGSMGNKIGYKRYVWRKLSEAQLKKEELEAYMIAAEKRGGNRETDGRKSGLSTVCFSNEARLIFH